MVWDDPWTAAFPVRRRPRPRAEGEEEIPYKDHPPEIVVCAFCGFEIEDDYWPYHPCTGREEAMRQRKRLEDAGER